MSAITLPISKHRANSHRIFAPGEQRMLNSELGNLGRPQSMHWRLLVKLAIETGATPSDLSGAAWTQFDDQLRLWTVPRSRQGKRYEPKPIVLTRKGTRVLRILKKLAHPTSERVFHSLPQTPQGLSVSFGWSAARAGLIDFCMKDFLNIAIAKRVAASPSARVEEITWAMGIRHRQPAPNIRAYRNKEAQPHQPWTNSASRGMRLKN